MNWAMSEDHDITDKSYAQRNANKDTNQALKMPLMNKP